METIDILGLYAYSHRLLNFGFSDIEMTRFKYDGQYSYKKLLYRVFILCLTAMFSLPAYADSTIEGNIDDIARAILTYFPKVTGKVTAVNDTEIEVLLESGQGLSEGILLTVFREGETFHHPVTKIPLGRFENEVGFIEVVDFSKNRLVAKNTKPAKDIEVDDLVRLPSTKIPLAIATRSEKDHGFLQNELVAALSETGRFQIDTLTPGTDYKAALDRKNRYHIEMKTDHQDGRFVLTLLIQNTITGKALANMDVSIHQSRESDLILEHLQFQLFEQRQKNSSND